MKISLFVFLFASLLSVVPLARGEEADAAKTAAIDRAALGAFQASRGKPGSVVVHLDLSQAFKTQSPWSFVAVQGPTESNSALGEDTGPGEIAFCLLRENVPDCAGPSYALVASRFASTFWDKGIDAHHQVEAKIAFAGDPVRKPLLVIVAVSFPSANGNALLSTYVLGYDRSRDRFVGLFANGTGRNNNERTRLIESGPLAGSIVVDEATPNAPFAYFITVYRQSSFGAYEQTLRYRSLTRYGDGNSLAVIDSEMPEILRRLGLRKPGDPLPEPPKRPDGCTSLTLRKGVEVCG